jgi:hypothetical protein
MRVFVLLALFTLSAQEQFVNSKIRHVKHRFQTALVFPAQVSIVRITIRGKSSMAAEGDRIGDGLSAVVHAYFSGKGVKVLSAVEAVRTDVERDALQEMQRKYDTLALQMLKSPKGVRTGRFTLGNSGNICTSADCPDSLIFVRGKGSVLDQAERMMGLIPSPFAWFSKDQRFDGSIGFADARSGELLLLLEFTTYGHGWNETAEELKPRVRDAAIKMPIPIETLLGAP